MLGIQRQGHRKDSNLKPLAFSWFVKGFGALEALLHRNLAVYRGQPPFILRGIARMEARKRVEALKLGGLKGLWALVAAEVLKAWLQTQRALVALGLGLQALSLCGLGGLGGLQALESGLSSRRLRLRRQRWWRRGLGEAGEKLRC